MTEIKLLPLTPSILNFTNRNMSYSSKLSEFKELINKKCIYIYVQMPLQIYNFLVMAKNIGTLAILPKNVTLPSANYCSCKRFQLQFQFRNNSTQNPKYLSTVRSPWFCHISFGKLQSCFFMPLCQQWRPPGSPTMLFHPRPGRLATVPWTVNLLMILRTVDPGTLRSLEMDL